MKTIILTVILFVFRLAVCTGFTNKLDSVLYTYTSSFPDSTQLSIGIISNGETHYYGFIKKENQLIPVSNKNKVFEIGSITKVFTSTMLARLICSEKINPDTSIQSMLSLPSRSSGFDISKITLKNLSNHTSGLPELPSNFNNFFNDSTNWLVYDKPTLEHFIKNNLTLISAPGQTYNYSNFGYALLAYLMEKHKNSDYESLLNDFICTPYNLESTTSKYHKVKNKMAEGRDSKGRTIPNKDWGIFKASGGVLSNVDDLVKFINANFEDDQTLALQQKETFSYGNSGVALGWLLTKFGKGCKWHSHTGRMDGYCSSLYMDVSSKIAVVVLSNLSSHHPQNDMVDKLSFALMKSEYLKTSHAECKNAFIENAITEGWGTHILDDLLKTAIKINPLVGVWTRNNNNRTITRAFTNDMKVQTDFYLEEEIDVWGNYKTDGDKIIFRDIGGAACTSVGKYEFQINKDTLQFKVLSDHCNGRKADLSNKWIRKK